MEDDPGRPTDTVFYCRIGTGLGLEVLAELFLIIANARIYSVYGNLITDNDAQCYLKAGFSLFLIATIIQAALIIFDGIVLLVYCQARAPCDCTCAYLKIISQFVSFMSVVLGSMIYGIKAQDKIGWGFWMALAAGFFCCINGVVWFLTQQMRSFLQKKGVDIKTLERGGQIE